MIRLTSQLIHANRTPAGAWTRAQVEALGVKWPPRHGWIYRLHGKEITEDQWRQFMAGRNVRSKELKKMKREAIQTCLSFDI